MNECCSDNSKLKIAGHVSFLDALGLLILLPFYGFVIWGASYLVVTIATNLLSTFWDSHAYTVFFHLLALFITMAWFVLKSLPKFLHACSFLLNYKLHIFHVCNTCGHKKDLLNVPKESDPFNGRT